MQNLALKQQDNPPAISFIDLKAQQDVIRPQLDAAIQRVMDHGKYIMGPEIKEVESKLADFCGAKHAITVSSGTDALQVALMAKGIGPGDAVFLPSFTFTATPEVVALLGADPIFVDVESQNFNISPASLKQAIEKAKKCGLTPKAVIAVDLFGQPADYDSLSAIAHENNLWILDDAAQSFGASYKEKPVGSLSEITATSFFPAKPLGCYGDGGAVFTDSDELAETIKSLRVHGKGTNKYDNVRIGVNARFDTLQAAILLEKLKLFPQEIISRQKAAEAYNKGLEEVVQVPRVAENTTSVWAQYTVILPENTNRSELQEKLKTYGVPTAIYYPKPLHQQVAYEKFLQADFLKVSEDLSQRVLSLPIHGYLSEDTQDYIIESFKAAIKAVL